MTITERMAAWRRERRVLRRVSRAAWRLEQAERERAWALASARAEEISIRTLAAAAGLSPARVHQITAAADLDELDAALGELRAAGWPAPEDPDGDDDAELDGRDLICDRLLDEVDWLRQCAGWLTHLHTSEYPPAVNLRPDGDHPDRAHLAADLPRLAAIVQRIAADIDELARARRVADLGAAAALPDRRAERRRRVVEPDLDFREFCRRGKLPQSERSWDLFAAERYRRGETDIPSYDGSDPRSILSRRPQSRYSHDTDRRPHRRRQALRPRARPADRPPDHTRKCFMGPQRGGWDCGFSNGEGLSRFCAEQETPAGTLSAFVTGPAWAQAGFPDWVTQTEQTDQDAVSTGCSIVYIYWMRSLGYTIPQIVQAAGPTLLANYQALTQCHLP